jgi:hypothetical protein
MSVDSLERSVVTGRPLAYHSVVDRTSYPDGLSEPILSLRGVRHALRGRRSGNIEGGEAREEYVQLGLFDRFRSGRAISDHGPAADLRYLREWAAQRSGVEAFVEPRTTVTEVTVVLVAGDGEWTRRRAGGEAGARRLSERLHIPVYDVQKVGYPQRMRDYDARRRIERRRAAEELDER